MGVGKGRPRKPIELHKRDGTFQPVRHAGIVEPLYPDGLPQPPSYLTAAAKRVYRHYGMLMVGARVMTEADAGILASFAQAEAYLAVASKRYQADMTDSAARRDVIEWTNQKLKSASLLGLAPVLRSKVRPNAESDTRKADPMAEFLA